MRSQPDTVAGMVGHAGQLRAVQDEIKRLREEHAHKVASLAASVDTLAQHVEVLTLENQRLHQAIAHEAGLVEFPGSQR